MDILRSIRIKLARWLSPAPDKSIAEAQFTVLDESLEADVDSAATTLVRSKHTTIAYDENLYEGARTQWQFGDWASLILIERESIQHHPERAKLALMIAAGHLQSNNNTVARHFIKLAQEWGCSKKLITQILVAGVHNSLARAATVAGQEVRALKHFENAITVGSPGSDQRLLSQARINEQSSQLGLDLQGGARQVVRQVLPGQAMASTRITVLARQCLQGPDIHKAVDNIIAANKLSTHELILFYMELADQFFERKDSLTSIHFLETARELIGEDTDNNLKTLLVKKLIAVGKVDKAADIAVKESLLHNNNLQLSPKENAALQAQFEQVRHAQQVKSEHGHDLLLAWLRAHIDTILAESSEHKPVLIEIGTTRENVPDQGSTRKLAQFCKEAGLHFITVDMDPHNTHIATEVFRELEAPFEAITALGEEYLRAYPGKFDFIFLDAYDFDHGKHSDLRQSRYEKFLGHPIDDAECHLMHLECAKSIVTKLSPQGVVCLDDTWLNEGNWTAKGTLAMPYLLANNFRLIEVRNRAALLARNIEATCEAN